MIVYKLLTQDNQTYKGTQWGEGVEHRTDGKGELCGPGWLHFYSCPELAVLMNPIHANIQNPKLWEAEAEGFFRDDRGLKCGCTILRTVRELPLPACTTEQRVEFAIRCALAVFNDDIKFKKWADEWLSGKDRTSGAAAAWAGAAAWGAAAWAGAAAAGAAADAAWAAWAAAWADVTLNIAAIAKQVLNSNGVQSCP